MKMFLLVLLLVDFGFGYSQCVEGDCYSDSGKYICVIGEEYLIYEGQWKYGLPNGLGVIDFPNGVEFLKCDGSVDFKELCGQVSLIEIRKRFSLTSSRILKSEEEL